MKPKASILIITFNQADSIGEAIESILDQCCDYPFEIIIGDDASTDGTRRICEEYVCKYPEIIRIMPSAPNKGLVDNYFDCLLAARGEYVSDCAGDDTWADARRLQKQIEYLDGHPGDAAVISDWSIYDNRVCVNSKEIPQYQQYLKHNSGPEFMRMVLGCTGNFPLFSAMLYRREILTEILAERPSDLRCKKWGCEDMPAVVALCAHGGIGYIPVNAYTYTLNDGSVSNNPRPDKQFDFYIKAANCVLDLCRIYDIPLNDIAPALISRARYLGALSIECGDDARCDQFRSLCARMPGLNDLKTRIYQWAACRKWSRNLLNNLKNLYHGSKT